MLRIIATHCAPENLSNQQIDRKSHQNTTQNRACLVEFQNRNNYLIYPLLVVNNKNRIHAAQK